MLLSRVHMRAENGLGKGGGDTVRANGSELGYLWCVYAADGLWSMSKQIVQE